MYCKEVIKSMTHTEILLVHKPNICHNLYYIYQHWPMANSVSLFAICSFPNIFFLLRRQCVCVICVNCCRQQFEPSRKHKLTRIPLQASGLLHAEPLICNLIDWMKLVNGTWAVSINQGIPSCFLTMNEKRNSCVYFPVARVNNDFAFTS